MLLGVEGTLPCADQVRNKQIYVKILTPSPSQNFDPYGSVHRFLGRMSIGGYHNCRGQLKFE